MEEQDHDGSRPKRYGKKLQIDVYNNIKYASELEHGFRSHFVPGEWEGETFVYKEFKPGADDNPDGGMYVGPKGGFVKGHWVMKRAIRNTKATQDARLKRKIENILTDRLGPEWRNHS